MYHISADIRAKKSASKIVAGLITIAQTKSLPDITVSDLLKTSKVSRSTFYRLFDNIIDVLEYECDCITKQILAAEGNLDTFHAQNFFIYLIDSLMAHDNLLEILIKSHRIDIFCISFRKNFSSINKYLYSLEPIEAETADYINNIIAVLFPSMITTWIQHEKTETKEQVYLRMKTCIQILNKLD